MAKGCAAGVSVEMRAWRAIGELNRLIGKTPKTCTQRSCCFLPRTLQQTVSCRCYHPECAPLNIHLSWKKLRIEGILLVYSTPSTRLLGTRTMPSFLPFLLLVVLIGAHGVAVVAQIYECSSGCSLDVKTQGPPVVGQDGNTYFNACLAYCQGIEIAYETEFPENITAAESYDVDATVSLEDMNRYQDEGFYLVSKRLRESFLSEFDPNEYDPFQGEWPSFDTIPEVIRALRISYDDGLEYAKTYSSEEMGKVDTFPFPPSISENDASVVYGTDERREVVVTTGFPIRTVGHLEIGAGTCTGTVISKTSVLSAGHCVYNTNTNQWYSLTNFIPARFRSGSTVTDPYGKWEPEYATTFSPYVNAKDIRYDISVIRIKKRGNDVTCTFIGDSESAGGVDFVGLSTTSIASSALNAATIYGYPGDKPYGSMWTSGDCNPKTACGYDFFACYTCDTAGGMSGSSMLGTDSISYGVHAYGNVANQEQNGGPIISDQARLNILIEWSQGDQTITCASNPAPLPTPSPPPPAAGPNSNFCFSDKNSVEVLDMGFVTMDKLKVGDYVRVGNNKFATVYTFAHMNSQTETVYFQFKIENVADILEATADHHIFVYHNQNIKTLSASKIRIGDYVLSSTGSPERVLKIDSVKRKGLYAPFTTTGDIVVSGVLVSNYASFSAVEKLGRSFPFHWMAHTYMSPHRLLCKVNFDWCANESFTPDGVSYWLGGYHHLGRNTSDAWQVILFAMLLPVMLTFLFIEILTPLRILGTLVGICVVYFCTGGIKRTRNKTKNL